MAFLLGLPCLTHTACDGDGKSPYELGPYHMGEYWRSFVYFKEGTWWVYRSIQGRDTLYDTVKVVASNWEMVRYADESPRNWKVTKEWFRYVMTSTVQEDIIHQIPRLGLLTGDSVPFSRFFMERNVWGDGTIRAFFIWRVDHQKTADGVSETTLSGKYDDTSIVDLGKMDVISFDVSDDFSSHDNGQPHRYYWGKNFGIVQRENLVTGETWELIDYEIM